VTLIAAYREHGVPVLLGDFLLTISNVAGLQQAGSRKKVHLLHGNLAVGWTGRQFVAEDVLTRLHERFRAERPTRQALEAFLKSIPVNQYPTGTVCLIGWICEEQPYCFRWRADWPKEVFYADFHVDGSGASVVEDFVRGATQHLPDAASRHSPVVAALSLTGYLIEDDIWVGANHAAGFGYAYEVLMLEDGEFRYVNDVLYLAVTCPFDHTGRYLTPTLNRIAYKVDHIGDHTIVEMRRLGEGQVIRRDLIAPAYRVTDAEDEAATVATVNYPYTFAARHSCLIATFVRDADTQGPAGPMMLAAPLVFVTCAGESPQMFTVTWTADPIRPLDGTLNVELPPRHLFETVYRDQIAAIAPLTVRST